MEHRLKCCPEFFKDIRARLKTFELRKDDRPFEDGDTLILEEFCPEKQKFTGESVYMHVLKVYRGLDAFGLQPGYCILALANY